MTTATQTANVKAPVQNAYAMRDQLVLEHMDLVKVIACQVRRNLAVHVELDDLMNAGMMGLLEAATKFEGDKEVPFTVYAKHRIRGSILDSLRQVDWATRDARRQYKQIDVVSRELSAKLQRVPTQEEVAGAMGLDSRRWQTLMIDYRTLGTSTSPRKNQDGEEKPAKEIPAAKEASPESVFARRELKQQISVAVETLPERYQKVVKMYYEGDMTMKEIGSMLGVNESRVSQIHKTALAKIQVILTSNGISQTVSFC
jgi:RNA polymerase sigma factor for flagellar operon FliA